MRLSLFWITVPAAAVCVAACGSYPRRHEVDWSQGARRGAVASIYTSRTPRTELPACLVKLDAEQLDQHHYAAIRYRHVRQMVGEVAEFPDGVTLTLGDTVEFWPADCAAGQLSRISRVMPVDSE